MNLKDQLFKQCKTAISVYDAHTKNNVLEFVSDEALSKIANYAYTNKAELRDMLRNHPNWDEKTQSVVLKTMVNRAPNPYKLSSYWHSLCYTSNLREKIGYETNVVFDIKEWLISDGEVTEEMKKFMDWHRGQKKNRLLRKFLVSLDAWDEKNPEQQKYFALLSDELKTGEREISLILSINPAHFLTMSNPEECTEGDMLTSCHSLNSTEYDYNNGCTGYAADSITMIAFTVSNIKDADSWFYRKTSRQLFMYKPESGVLLQSRMYNTEGGLSGTDENTKTYRNLVQDCICKCESANNHWKTCTYNGNKYDIEFYTDCDFGGYADWEYEEFCAKVSVRDDWNNNKIRFRVGDSGICLSCGDSIREGIYCEDCAGEDF